MGGDHLKGAVARRSRPSGPPQLRVAFLLQPRFTLLAYSSFVDVLRHAADEADNSRQILCRWIVLGEQDSTLPASCGIEVRPELPLDAVDLHDLDYVVVVGGLMSSASQMNPKAYDLLRRARTLGVGLVGLCTGFVHLARAGLLDGRRVATPWMYESLLADNHPLAIPVSGQAFVEDDGILTALGGIAGLELALKLVERHCGTRRARKCADRLCVEATFAAHRIDKATADRYAVSGDRHLERAAEIMRRRTDPKYDVAALATEVGISARQLRTIFKRHTGKTPSRFWREMRLYEARWRLVNSAESTTQIAYATGFSDASHFSRAFKAAFGDTPRAYRQLRLRADLFRTD